MDNNQILVVENNAGDEALTLRVSTRPTLSTTRQESIGNASKHQGMSKTLRVLNVEDSERDVSLLTRFLSRSGSEVISDRVDTAEAMTLALESREWDVVLCDYTMPNFNALAALALMKEMKKDIPFIIISGSVGEAAAVEAMRAGAHDYLMKDNLARLRPTIERELHEAENRRARRRAEEQLRGSQLYTRLLMESNIDALMTTDPLGIITDVNQQMEILAGHARDELIGTAFKQYFTDPELAEEGIRLVVREGRVTNYELTARSRDGAETVVSYNATTFNDQAGNLQGVFGAARDVTERKRFEQALQDKNVELERANLAKDRFLATMSHELRTPLNAIIGFTGTLLMKLPGPLTSDQEHQIKIVQSSGRHLLSLINDLLDLAKIESGKVEMRYEPISCQAVIADVAAALRPLAEKKGLDFEVKGPKACVRVDSDRRILSQILINLTNNAIKFTDRGKIQIELGTQPSNGHMLATINVTDTGTGIRPDDKQKLFQAFQQVDTGHRGEGTGLGLYLSQKLAVLINGRIELESEYGKGSVFRLLIPQD